MFRRYGKAIVAFGYAVAFVAIPQVTGDGHLDPAEAVTIAIAVATNAGVFLIPLAPGAKWAKTAVGAILAGLQVATTLILDYKIDATEALMIAAAVLGAAGIYVAPAISEPAGQPEVAVGVGRDA